MPKIRYGEWVTISEEVTKLRIKIVSQFKDFNSAQETFKAATDLKGAGWDSGRNYFEGYKEVSEAIFNALYTVDDVTKNYVSAFTAEVGPAENDLDTDRMEELKAELRHLQVQNDILMEAAAKALENVPLINKFFLKRSMLGTAQKIEILEKYQTFESGHSGDFQEVQSVITSITQGVAALGNAGHFIGGKEGFKPVAWKDQEWLKKLQAYNEKNSGDRYEIVVVHEDHDGKTFAIYKNGKIDHNRSIEYNKLLAKEDWALLMKLGPEVLKVLIGLDDVEVLLDDNSGTGQKVKASIFLLLAVTPADKVKDVIKSAKMLAKGNHVLDGVKITAKQLEMLKDLDKTGDRVKITKKASGVKSIITPEMEEKILWGQRTNPNKNKIIGGHSPEISNNHPNYAVEEIILNPDGTRKLKYTTQFPDGNLSKIKTSTVFPEGWSDTKILESSKRIGNNTPINVRTSDGATWHRSIVDGVEIDVIKRGNEIISAYPTGTVNGPPPVGFSK